MVSNERLEQLQDIIDTQDHLVREYRNKRFDTSSDGMHRDNRMQRSFIEELKEDSRT